jgi:hypothetical protein
VLQIIDDSHALITNQLESLDDEHITLFAELDTDGKVDGAVLYGNWFVHCIGRVSYTSALGAKRTVWKVRLIRD